MQTFFRNAFASATAAAALVLALPAASFAQIEPGSYGYYNNAVQLGQTDVYGTARTQAMGGSRIALGGDISSLAGNPAGLGMIKRSQAMISPSIMSNSTSSTFINRTLDDGRTKFNIANLGLVISAPKDELVEGSWRGGSFGVSMTRLANYNSQQSYSAVNPAVIGYQKINDNYSLPYTANSYIDYLVRLGRQQGIGQSVAVLGDSIKNGANITPLNPAQSEIYQAYRAYLLDYSPPGIGSRPDDIYGNYFGRILPLGDMQQTMIRKTSGATNQFDIGGGGNINDMFYFGASLGIVSTWYREETVYRETLVNIKDSLHFTGATANKYIGTSLLRQQNMSTDGQGVNVKLGVIIRPIPQLRIGLNWQSASAMYLQQKSWMKVSATYPTAAPYPDSLLYYPNLPGDDRTVFLQNPFSYNLNLPMKTSVGLVYQFNKQGLITAEAEYLDYTQSKLSYDTDPTSANPNLFNADNQTIKNIHQGVINLRGGGEFRVDKVQFRLGAAYTGSPYKSNYSDSFNYLNKEVISYTGGLGYRADSFFIDLSYVMSNYTSRVSALDASGQFSPQANIKGHTNNVVVTTGFTF